MKASEARRILRAIRAAVPNLIESGRLLVAMPMNHVLRGFYLENSSTRGAFYAWVFVQPLFVPSTTVHFNFGKRLGGPSTLWRAMDSPERLIATIVAEGIPYLSELTSPAALSDWEFLVGNSDPYAREARSYSMVLSGRIAEALPELWRLIGDLAGGTAWMVAMSARAERLAKLAEHDPAAARIQLAQWELETVKSLRLTDVEGSRYGGA